MGATTDMDAGITVGERIAATDTAMTGITVAIMGAGSATTSKRKWVQAVGGFYPLPRFYVNKYLTYKFAISGSAYTMNVASLMRMGGQKYIFRQDYEAYGKKLDISTLLVKRSKLNELT